MVDLTKPEDFIDVKAARQLFPGRKPHVHTVLRYCRHGVAGILLDSIKWNGTVLTTPAAVIEFLQAIGTRHQIKPQTAQPAKSKADARRRAKRVLDKAGV